VDNPSNKKDESTEFIERCFADVNARLAPTSFGIKAYCLIIGLLFASLLGSTIVGLSTRDEYGVSVLKYEVGTELHNSERLQFYRWIDPENISKGSVHINRFDENFVKCYFIIGWFWTSVGFYGMGTLLAAILVTLSIERFALWTVGLLTASYVADKVSKKDKKSDEMSSSSVTLLAIGALPVMCIWVYLVVAIPVILFRYVKYQLCRA